MESALYGTTHSRFVSEITEISKISDISTTL